MNTKTHPFVIWTTQRTGSTVISDILTRLIGRTVSHEPFNKNRYLAYHKDPDTLSHHLKNLDGLCFKHCWNVHGKKINRMILDQVILDKYSFILLTRKNVLKMWLSQRIAKQTGVWGKKSVSADYFEKELRPIDIDLLKHDVIKYTRDLKQNRHLLAQEACSVFEISYEDLFEGDIQSRFTHLDRLCRILQIAPPSIDDASIVDLVMYHKQDTDKLYPHVPNIQDVQNAFPEYDLQIQTTFTSPAGDAEPTD